MKSRPILIVEDEPHIAAVVALKLERAGYVAVTCATIAEATRALDQRRFALVIADVHLVGESGLDLAASLSVPNDTNKNAHTPVLILTGMGHHLESLTLPKSVRDVLTKPFSPTELLARAERLMGLAAPSTSASKRHANAARDAA